jgi:transglutaminase-like putative cysteine protease
MCEANAQKNTNVTLARQLKTYGQNKKAKLVASRSYSNYTFQVSGQQLSVINEGTADLISLEGNLDHVEYLHYDNHTKVEKSDFRFTSGKGLIPAKSCGNYEVGDIFFSDAKVCSYRMNFLNEGTEISFDWRTVLDDPRYLTKVFFHDDKPIESIEITFTIPQSVNVELKEMNFEGFAITKAVTKNDGKTVYRYKAKRLEVLKSEDNSLGYLYYYPHIMVLTKDYATTAGKKNVIASVTDLYNWYSGLVKQVKNEPAQLKPEVDRLTVSLKTPEEKMRAIYYWIQDNIKYIAFEDGIAGFKPEAAQKVYHDRFGDCKGMANLTKEMLKLAGLDARLTWIGTKRIPYSYQTPSLCVDNHMICTVLLKGEYYILDATEKYIALGKNAERIQGKEMLIEDGESFIVKTVPDADAAGNLVVRTESIQLDADALKGEGQLVMNGEAKKSVLYYSANVKHEDQRKLFDNLAMPDYTNTDKVEVTDAPAIDREKPLNVQYKFALGNKISRFNNDIYINLDWAKSFHNLKLEDDRVTDYYFNRKFKTRTIKKFKLPAGYSVTHLPKNMNRVFNDFSFLITYKVVGNELHYENHITINNGIVKKQNFGMWNECIKELKEIYDDQVVITKK